MRVVIGSVVKGFQLKSAVKQWLVDNGYEVVDVGCPDMDSFAKFPSVAERAARVLQEGGADLGVLCCGSGTGMALGANKFRGISAVCCESPMSAEMSRKVNDANVLCMGESLVAPDMGCKMTEIFLTTEFQDAPAIPEKVRDFWREARDEIMARGDEACERDVETMS